MTGCRQIGRLWRKTSLSSPSSSFSRLLWCMVPFILLFGVVYAANWLFAPKYQPRTPELLFSVTSKPSTSEAEGGIPNSLSPGTKEIGSEADFQGKRSIVLGGGSSDDEGLHDNRRLNYSTSPPPADTEDTRKPAVTKEDVLSSTFNTTHVLPALSGTLARPPSPRTKRNFSKLENLEARMQQARAAIRAATNGNQLNDRDYIPNGPMYWNPKSFHRSYLEMEKQFKIFVYDEGEPPIFHNGPCKSTYAMEGNFIYYMETSPFRTRDPDRAHIFFLPISVTSIVHFIYNSKTKKRWRPLIYTVRDYVNLVSGRYPYWNRSLGADHFMVACHDWGPKLSSSVPDLRKNSIRGLCNANTSEGFDPSKDVSFPEVYLPRGTIDGLIGGPSPSQRPILAFFAGGLHGPIRPILLEHWENKDEDVQVHKYLPKGVSYSGMMKKSKYCICPSGYEVATPRIVEALDSGCVPVLINDHYVPPFGDVLNWKTFSVEVPVKDIPNLKKLLTSISMGRYVRLQREGQQVRRHFEVSFPPKRYDVFHMILHSVWLRRLDIRLHGVEDW